MNKKRLKNYARLIAKAGVNVQKGQEVLITAELDQPEFVRMVADECYRLGASKVSVDWTYQPLMRSDVRYCSGKVLGHLEDWQIERWEHQAKVLPCKIYLISEDPDGLNGINQKKYAAAMRERAATIKPIRNRMENRYQWCIAAVPGNAWAKKLFPDTRVSTSVEKLWSAILDTSRVDDNPVAAWDRHNEDLQSRCDYLNSLKIRELHYKAANGTDFRVGLLPNALFCAGGERTLGGTYFNPNIPTEEVFTSPRRGDADGIVYSSKPLSYGGQLIENFWIRFEGGRAVEVGAEKGEKLLREIIGMDEGAAYLGECALVPYESPINKTGILFYNTLFDENAACHLALGRGFTNLIRDYEKYSEEELHKMGINDSIVHEDFMIGTPDLSITALTEDGKTVEIFKNGTFSF